MNIVTLCGYLGNEWESNISTEANGEKWFARNVLAISKAWTNKKGQKVEQTSWIPIVIFGKNAKTAVTYTIKGNGFLLNGELMTELYQVTDEATGEIKNRQSWQVIVKQFDLKASNNKKPMDTEVQEEEDKSIKASGDIEIAYHDEKGNVIPIPNPIPQPMQPA